MHGNPSEEAEPEALARVWWENGERIDRQAKMVGRSDQRISGQCVVDYIVPMVGAAGFEPTTPRTPSECATGLRYAPTRPTSMLPTRLDAAARITGTVQAECESIIRMIA